MGWLLLTWVEISIIPDMSPIAPIFYSSSFLEPVLKLVSEPLIYPLFEPLLDLLIDIFVDGLPHLPQPPSHPAWVLGTVVLCGGDQAD